MSISVSSDSEEVEMMILMFTQMMLEQKYTKHNLQDNNIYERFTHRISLSLVEWINFRIH